MKKIILCVIAVIALVLTSCDNQLSSDEIQQSKQENLKQEAVKQVGMPNVQNFAQMRFAKLVIEMCDQSNLVNYVYLKAEMTGKLVFLGKCIGYGLPYATQFTNPSQIAFSNGYHEVLPQCDPDGLFKPSTANGTWLLMINPQTHEPCVSYIEDNVNILGFPVNPEDGLSTKIDKPIDTKKLLEDAIQKLKVVENKH